MKLGVLARAEDRGLGIQTWEVCRHMDPARVLIVDMGDTGRGIPQHLDRFNEWDTFVVEREHLSNVAHMRLLVRGLDALYYAETPYDAALVEACDREGVRTVNHVNPEFFTAIDGEPTALWLPSRWLRERLPERAVYMPMPVATDRWPDALPEPYDGHRPLRVLHVTGYPAMADRNGTRSLLAALGHLRNRVHVTVATQAKRMPSPNRLPLGVTYSVSPAMRDYWKLYDNADVLVMPRRYGGLCLPVHEAAGAGLAIVMTRCSPNVTDYPCIGVRVNPGTTIMTKLGEIETHTALARDLATVIDGLAGNPDTLLAQQVTARDWAKAQSWEQQAPRWHAALDALR